jgi:hypothetical protein
MVLGELEDPDDVARAVADAMPDARRVRLPGLGHVGAFVDAEASLAQARPFLTAVAAGVPVPRSRD